MQIEMVEIIESIKVDKHSYVGLIEFQDNSGEWYDFEIYKTKRFLAFGGNCNAGFLISGFIERESYESIDETLQELLEDLKVYYNEGPEYVSRIKCNERM
jgi:hypothetical protein